ncbi:MAG: Re/Si-specific NAD(P)(+) transhydrogenase subunit alpha [Gammaproteobacteria bacterium]|nr:Re/Si-specific NAD(P)(+) transhydrogenase subunit alpha [Gammaproteobacteria bacterium]MBI5617439.1 Re/Si-specific NAD(P)(+) transhydrogenase subunit alpha [Gammaproteobacteria bacterium]
MRIGVPKEVHAGERRVATTPDVAAKLIKLGFTVAIESGAGAAADLDDDAFRAAGVEIVPDARTLWAESDVVLKVRGPEPHPGLGCHEADLLREGGMLASFLWPAQNPELLERLAARKGTVIAMDSVPRISRAQKLDTLSSMANIAGYRAVIEAAQHFGRFFTGQVTAAGKVPPAKVFIIGAGVAGLAAIGAANGMGAIVRAMDTRPEVKDQVKSLGAEFVEVDYKEEGSSTAGGYAKVMSEGYQAAQKATTAKQCQECDVVITTALIPGKPAPRLITAEMVQAMQPGSVIVDLAAEQGGNCELTVPGQVVVRHGVNIIGYTDLPSRMARQSSQLYGTNLLRLMEELCKAKDGVAVVNMEDEMIRGATVVKEGTITWPPPPISVSAAPQKPAAAAPAAKPEEKKPLVPAPVRKALFAAIGAYALYTLGAYAPAAFMSHFMVFVLACFVGYMVIWNVTPALHTPLMSVTNAISSIISIGALIQISSPGFWMTVLAGLALLLTSVNTIGGFAVTQRMLAMFRKSG